MISLVRRVLRRLRSLYRQIRGPFPNFKLYLPYIEKKQGLEIGGPSSSFRQRAVAPVYARIASLDNCDFSSNTVWAAHGKDFLYLPSKPPGTSFFCEGSQLTPIADHSYDLVLSSHNLEHFANPVKALHEWKRVLRPGGALIVLLPYYRKTFDHRRSPTPVSHMLEDFRQNIGEDDLTHLPEILEKHDLVLDPPAGSIDDFRKRSLDNINNRCLHHHVFDETNSRELLASAGFHVLSVDVVEPHNICLLAHA